MSKTKKDKSEEQNKTEKPLMGVCQMIVESTEAFNKLLSDSLNIYDQALYFIRQDFFKKPFEERDITKYDIPSKNKLHKLIRSTPKFKNSILDYNVRQYAVEQAREAFKDWKEAMIKYKKNPSDFSGQPEIPHYKYFKKFYNKITIDKTRFKSFDRVKRELYIPKTDIRIKIPEYINIDKIRCLVVTKHYNKIKITFNYFAEFKNIDNKYKLKRSSCVGVDPGVNNLFALTTNDKAGSLIINGRQIKCLIQWYNKSLARMNSELPLLPKAKRTEYVTQVKTSKAITDLCLKHSNQLRNICDEVSKMVIDFCLKQKSGTIIVGKNKYWKTGGMKNKNKEVEKQNNQNFINMPIARILERIQYKAHLYGIQYIEVEESYTSKTDHLMFEKMEHMEKSERSGRRIHRGLFKSGCGKVFNADINGAIGMLRKAKVISKKQLMLMRDRGDIVTPEVRNIFILQQKKKKKCKYSK